MLKDEVLNEYIKYELKSNEDNKYNGEDASQIFSNLNYEQFIKVHTSILSHQSEYFRAIYNKKEKEIDYGHLAINATELAKKAFKTYNVNSNGYIERCKHHSYLIF
jgi:Ca2+-binding EF-hand superfamily protein